MTKCMRCGEPHEDLEPGCEAMCDRCFEELMGRKKPYKVSVECVWENGRLLDQAFKAHPLPNKCFACGTPMNGVGLCRSCQGMRTGFHTKYFRRKLTALLMEAVDESAKAANKVRSIANQLANLDK